MPHVPSTPARRPRRSTPPAVARLAVTLLAVAAMTVACITKSDPRLGDSDFGPDDFGGYAMPAPAAS